MAATHSLGALSKAWSFRFRMERDSSDDGSGIITADPRETQGRNDVASALLRPEQALQYPSNTIGL
jgi:hypothetical protein